MGYEGFQMDTNYAEYNRRLPVDLFNLVYCRRACQYRKVATDCESSSNLCLRASHVKIKMKLSAVEIHFWSVKKYKHSGSEVASLAFGLFGGS